MQPSWQLGGEDITESKSKQELCAQQQYHGMSVKSISPPVRPLKTLPPPQALLSSPRHVPHFRSMTDTTVPEVTPNMPL